MSHLQPRADVPRDDPFAALNDDQRRVVEHDGSGPLLVLAGAGSGKTTTLAARVARLVRDGADPQRILLLTFSRRAAHAMRHRAARLLHRALGFAPTQPAPQLHWAGTFHGIAARLLREHAPRIGLAETFTVADRSDAEDLLGDVRQRLGLASTQHRFPLKATCLSIYSRVVNSQQPLAAVLKADYPWCSTWHDELKRLFAAYLAEKQQQHLLDYDDLLLYWWQMMTEPSIARDMAGRFDHVLVDEYQDTNRLQAAILALLKPDGRGLCVVGDDAQAIYSFRAAEVRNILDFPARFQPPAPIVTLTRNYRSTQPLLDASNQLIAQAHEGFAKRLWSEQASSVRPQLVSVDDEAAQARWVADQALVHREAGIPLTQQAVLFRTSHHSAALELELTRRNIPYLKFGGLKFLEAAHIKDVLALLRWAQNPRCRLAGLRVALLVPGIGIATARRVVDALQQAADPCAAMAASRVPAAAAAGWAALVATWTGLRTPASAWPDELESVLRWYQPHLQRLHDDATVRQADLTQLARIAAGHASRERFLTELALDPPEATSDESGEPHRDEDYLILSTMHSAKGQEWTAVSVLNVVDGCIPSDMATGNQAEIDEERRLLYVAMTRAKHHLHLLVPQRFHVTQQATHGDRHLYGSLTRFIPPEVAACFDALGPTSPIEPVETLPAATVTPGPVTDIGARLRSMWA